MKKMVLVMVLVFIPMFAHATQVPEQACVVEKMLSDAKDAFCGVCKEAKIEKSNNPLAVSGTDTVYTLQVDRIMKGEHKQGDLVTCKQTGIMGMPNYICNGQHSYCWFLTGNPESGRCSPMGLSCGVFDIKVGPDGVSYIKGAVSKQTLFKNVLVRRPGISKSLNSSQKATITKPEKEVTLDDFVSIVDAIVKDQGGAK